MSLQVESLLQQCRERGLKLRTAESCTAGGIAAHIASVAGASDVLDRGWIVYSNAAKSEVLGIDPELIREHGAVSRQVVIAMAEGGASDDAACLAVSGIAGPAGGTPQKPVGTLWMAVKLPDQAIVSRLFQLSGSRSEIQAEAVSAAIDMLLECTS